MITLVLALAAGVQFYLFVEDHAVLNALAGTFLLAVCFFRVLRRNA